MTERVDDGESSERLQVEVELSRVLDRVHSATTARHEERQELSVLVTEANKRLYALDQEDREARSRLDATRAAAKGEIIRLILEDDNDLTARQAFPLLAVASDTSFDTSPARRAAIANEARRLANLQPNEYLLEVVDNHRPRVYAITRPLIPTKDGCELRVTEPGGRETVLTIKHPLVVQRSEDTYAPVRQIYAGVKQIGAAAAEHIANVPDKAASWVVSLNQLGLALEDTGLDQRYIAAAEEAMHNTVASILSDRADVKDAIDALFIRHDSVNRALVIGTLENIIARGLVHILDIYDDQDKAQDPVLLQAMSSMRMKLQMITGLAMAYGIKADIRSEAGMIELARQRRDIT